MGCEWPAMREDMREFIRTCPFCQKNASSAQDESTATILAPELFDTVAIDMIGPLPTSPDGYQYLIVIVDTFSRFVELRPSRDTTAMSAAKAMVDVFGRYGAPRHVKSDGGSQYTAAIINALLDGIRSQHLYSIPYRPSSNGVVERCNKEVLRHLRALVFDTRLTDAWPDYLPLVQRILNATPNQTTGVAPAQLVYGSLVSLNRGLLHPFSGNVNSGSDTDYLARLTKMQQHLVDKIKTAQQAYIEERSTSSPSPPAFSVGSLILIPFLPKTPNKLSTRLRGPLEVIEKISDHTYKVRHLSQKRELLCIFHRCLHTMPLTTCLPCKSPPLIMMNLKLMLSFLTKGQQSKL